MNPLFLLDPALTLDEFDHHYSFFDEISLTCQEMRIDLHVLASVGCKTKVFSHVTPFFNSQTYYFFENSDDYFSKIDSINAQIKGDYAKMDFCDGARILMHTATPWQLEGLADKFYKRTSVRIALGLSLPSSFWTKDPELQTLLDKVTWNAISRLERTNLFVYSETGSAVGRLNLPVSVSLMSDSTLRFCQSLAAGKSFGDDNCVTFGFFGGLFKHKGVSSVLAASDRALPAGHRIIFFVPPQHVDGLTELGAQGSKHVIFNTEPLKYEDYLATMSSVSAVLCCYDKTFYRDQMSGIVTEAAALGVPVVVTKETGLHRFLLSYSPGAAVPVDDVVNLGTTLALPGPYWREKKKGALISSSLVQELKSCRRFLNIALGYH